MNRLDPRRVDPDLHQRAGQRQFLDGEGIELEGDVALALLEEIRALSGEHEIEEPAQDAVLVQIGHLVERLGYDLLDGLGHLGRIGLALGVEQCPKQLIHLARDVGVAGQRLLHINQAEGDSRLAHVFGIGAQHADLAPVEPRAQHQFVESVVVHVAGENLGIGLVKDVLDRRDIDLGPVGGLHAEIVQPDVGPDPGRLKLEGHLGQHPQAHVLQRRQDLREG